MVITYLPWDDSRGNVYDCRRLSLSSLSQSLSLCMSLPVRQSLPIPCPLSLVYVSLFYELLSSLTWEPLSGIRPLGGCLFAEKGGGALWGQECFPPCLAPAIRHFCHILGHKRHLHHMQPTLAQLPRGQSDQVQLRAGLRVPSALGTFGDLFHFLKKNNEPGCRLAL